MTTQETRLQRRPPGAPARQRARASLRAGLPREDASSRRGSRRWPAERIEIPLVIGGREVRSGETAKAVMPHDHGHVLADWHKAGARARRAGDRRCRGGPRASGRAGRGRTGSRCSCGRPSCWRRRGARRSTRRRCSGQSKTAFQAEIDSAAELVDFWRFNPHFAQELYHEQPLSTTADVEPARLPAARGLRLRGDAVQLHLDRRQPADRARAHGQHGRVEAGVVRRSRAPTTS